MSLIPQGVSQAVSRQILTAQKNAPRTMFIAGIAGVVGSTVLACRATLKLDKTIKAVEIQIEEVKEIYDTAADHDTNLNQAMGRVYIAGACSIVKLYAAPVLLGGVSIGLLTGSHVALSRRNASLTAAFSALSMSFEAYRDRVREELGEERERHMYQGVEKFQKKVGKETEEHLVCTAGLGSMYAVFFDPQNRNWQQANMEYNRMFIRAQQNYANQMLISRGHVFLNEVYEMLGFPHTQAGAVVGWMYPNGADNYIDFGLLEEMTDRDEGGWTRSLILDFNVDGIIYDMI